MPCWGADVRGVFSLGSFYDHISCGRLSTESDQQINDVIQNFMDLL
jgi:hypothetical protein